MFGVFFDFINAHLIEIGTILSIIAGLIVFYRFVWLRPSLMITGHANRNLVYENRINSQIEFHIENRGRKFAEDAYVELFFWGWKFIGESESDLKVQIVLPSGDQLSPLELRSEIHNDTMAPGHEQEFVRIFVDDVIYKKKSFCIHRGVRTFDSEDTYKVDYEVACRGHRPRSGTIFFTADLDEGDISVDYTHPILRRRIARFIGFG